MVSDVDGKKYQLELEDASALLQKALPIGQCRDVGLLEVTAAIRALIGERDSYRKMVIGFRQQLNLLKMQEIQLIEAMKANCPVVY